MQPIRIVEWDELEPGSPHGILVEEVDLVVVRWPEAEHVSVLVAGLAGVTFGGIR